MYLETIRWVTNRHTDTGIHTHRVEAASLLPRNDMTSYPNACRFASAKCVYVCGRLVVGRKTLMMLGKPPHMHLWSSFCWCMCRNSILSFKMSASGYSTNLSISSKILNMLQEITTIIKDLDTLKKKEDQAQLNRLLYRSMDSLTVLKCQLLQLQVPYTNWHTIINHTILCPGCGQQWPHAHDFDYARYKY